MLNLSTSTLARGAIHGALFGGIMTLSAALMNASLGTLVGLIALGCLSVVFLKLPRSSLIVALSFVIAMPILFATPDGKPKPDIEAAHR